MEYVITADRPFEEIEAQTIEALERWGFVVQRTFSLRSAIRTEIGGTGEKPGYSVLMLYASDSQRRPLGLVTLYERGERTVISAVPASPDGTDENADLVAALILGGLEFCVGTVVGAECIDLGVTADDRADPG
jgi:hypothetical protein